MTKKQIGTLGLVINSIGVLVSAVSIRESDGYTESLRSGIQYHLASISSIGLKLGLFLIILGFVFQIYERGIKDGAKELTSTAVITYSFVTLLIYLLINFIAVFLFY